jgi:hypothetical protein
VKFLPEVLKYDPAAVRAVWAISAEGAKSEIPLADGAARVSVPARGLVLLQLDGIRAEVPVQRLGGGDAWCWGDGGAEHGIGI